MTHEPKSQQPLAHEVPSQTQTLPTQRWPVEQGPLFPQLQLPWSQLSALAALHPEQVAPLLPHWLVETAVTQLLP